MEAAIFVRPAQNHKFHECNLKFNRLNILGLGTLKTKHFCVICISMHHVT